MKIQKINSTLINTRNRFERVKTEEPNKPELNIDTRSKKNSKLNVLA